MFCKLEDLHAICQNKLGAGHECLVDPYDIVVEDASDPDEAGKLLALHKMLNLLEDFNALMNFYKSPIAAEGVLHIQENGRFELEGDEITSGTVLELLEEDEDGQRWVRSSIEHNGDEYYATEVKGPLEGKKARYRKRTF